MRQVKGDYTTEQMNRWKEFEHLCSLVPYDDSKDARLKRIAGMCGCAYQTVRLWHSGRGTGGAGKYYPPSSIVLAAFRANLELAKMKGEL